ncbi:MAG: ABC transporter [Propionibacteriaceae bacterium]|nr:ABC transporter [Propionibacteriaceae bacterium]
MAAGLEHSLKELRRELTQVSLPLPLPDAAATVTTARKVSGQLGDYVLPRLANLEAPLLAVVGGSTGAGKSTLVNSLLARVVTRPGVLRPTTKSPVLVYHPGDEHWFDDDRILAGLTRTRAQSDTPTALQLVSEPSLPLGLALLDAPDIDSVVSTNRALADTLLAAADLWLFVTSAARYSDAVPWDFLTAAADRAVAMAVVLNRVPPEAVTIVPADLRRMMDERGLAQVPEFVIPETTTDAAGLLPDAVVAELRAWLAALATDANERRAVVAQTLDGAIGNVVQKVQAVALAIDDQVNAATTLGEDATAAYQEAARVVAAQVSDGSLLRGEVLSRWHEYVGTSEFSKAIDAKVSWLKDKLSGLFRTQPQAGAQVQLAAGSGLEALLTEAGDAAAERAADVWGSSPAGRDLITSHPELARSSTHYQDAVARTIREWQSDVLELVASEGKTKRNTARIAAAGVNGIGAALMLFIFANTGGLTGAEVGVAGGTTVLAQKLLESIFGDTAVRTLAQTARDDLAARVQGLLAGELARFTVVLDGLGLDTRQPRRLRKITEAIKELRREHELGSGGRGPNELPPQDELLSITAPIRLEPEDDDIVDAELVEDDPIVIDLDATDLTEITDVPAPQSPEDDEDGEPA